MAVGFEVIVWRAKGAWDKDWRYFERECDALAHAFGAHGYGEIEPLYRLNKSKKLERSLLDKYQHDKWEITADGRIVFK